MANRAAPTMPARFSMVAGTTVQVTLVTVDLNLSHFLLTPPPMMNVSTPSRYSSVDR